MSYSEQLHELHALALKVKNIRIRREFVDCKENGRNYYKDLGDMG